MTGRGLIQRWWTIQHTMGKTSQTLTLYYICMSSFALLLNRVILGIAFLIRSSCLCMYNSTQCNPSFLSKKKIYNWLLSCWIYIVKNHNFIYSLFENGRNKCSMLIQSSLPNTSISIWTIHNILHGWDGVQFTAGLPSYPVGQVHIGLWALAWHLAVEAQALVNSHGSRQNDL